MRNVQTLDQDIENIYDNLELDEEEKSQFGSFFEQEIFMSI